MPQLRPMLEISQQERRWLGKNSIHGRVGRDKPLLSKKNTKAGLIFAKKVLKIPPRTFGMIFGRLLSATATFILPTHQQQS